MSGTWSRIAKLIGKGQKIRCSRTGTYYYESEMNDDGRGGKVAKKFDVFIHDQTIQQSRYKRGIGWQRGIKG